MNDQPNLIDAPIRTTMNDRIKAAQREVAMRRRVYPRWVAAGKMTQQKADYEIKLMEDIVETLARFQHAADF
jgi:hypothetical protein